MHIKIIVLSLFVLILCAVGHACLSLASNALEARQSAQAEVLRGYGF